MGVGHHLIAVLIFALGIGLGMGIEIHSSSAIPKIDTIDSAGNSPTVESAFDGASQEPLSMQELLLRFESLQDQEFEKETDRDVPSPQDWVPMDDIKVYDNHIVITLQDPQWAQYLDTNSMDPVIDSTSNTIQIIPKREGQIQVGDIVAYESPYHDGIITHRVVEIGNDEAGWFAILKGDNNPKADPGKVRFSQIRRVIVAVIY